MATHQDVHVAAVISVLGVLLGTARFPVIAGYRQLLLWARGFGTPRRAGGVHRLLRGGADPVPAGCGAWGLRGQLTAGDGVAVKDSPAVDQLRSASSDPNAFR